MKRLSGTLVVFALCLPWAHPSETPAGTRALTLQQAVSLALERSPEVLLARTQALQAGESVRESRALDRPQVTAGTGLAYNNGFPLSIEGSAPSIFKIIGSQSLFSAKNSNLVKESKESERAGEFAAGRVRNEVAARTALCYGRLHQARRVQALAGRRLEEALRRQEATESLLEGGKARPVDAAVARTASAAARQDLLVAREEARVLQAELRALTGTADTVSIETRDPLVQNPLEGEPAEEIYRRAVRSSPGILEAEASVRAREFHTAAEKGERHPRMNFVTEYALFSRSNNYEDYYRRFERHNYLLGLSIEVPLFTGSRTAARVARSRLEEEGERHRLEGLKSDLKVEIERALGALEIARGAADLARQDLETARELQALDEALFAEGRVSDQEMAARRFELQGKERALVDADHTLVERRIELLRLTGTAASALAE